MNLEQSLINFLEDGNQLTYDFEMAEPEFVGLCSLNELEIASIYIEGTVSGKSYYEIPAVNLTNENEYYDPEFILLWLPKEKKYGTWDSDHWTLYVFNNATWDEIVRNPLPYINCQWDPEQNVGTVYNPQGKYEMKEGWPF